MSLGGSKSGSALRFIASGGMADEDPDAVRELVTEAHALATAILSDPGASSALRSKAAVFLEDLRDDTYGHRESDKAGAAERPEDR